MLRAEEHSNISFSSVEGKISIEYNESNAKFKFNKNTLTCRLIDGKFPNYEAVIPKENPNEKKVKEQQITQKHIIIIIIVLPSPFSPP